MEICDINPFLRLACTMKYKASNNWAYVRDCRFFYVISGEARIFIDNHCYHLLPNSAFFCCAGNKYNFESEAVELIVLNFDLTQADNTNFSVLCPSSIEENGRVPYQNACIIDHYDFMNSHIFIENGVKYFAELNQILEETSAQLILFREKCNGILRNILIQLCRDSILTSKNSSEAVTRAIAYITQNYAEPLSNKDLARLTGYHEYYLNSLFIRHTGISMHKYLLKVRINEAKKMLLNTKLSLADIAEAVGFNSNTHFSTYFKKSENISPLQYRERVLSSVSG